MSDIYFGNLKIKKGACLAPMAGLTDAVFRKLANEFNISYTVTEMVSAKALIYNDLKTRKLCQNYTQNSPFGIQLFGCVPEELAEAAKIVLQFKPDFIDINMGCPAPKITNGGNGSALMKNPTLAQECVRQVVNSVNIPVTVKMRKGWDNNSINYVEMAKRCEQAGAVAVQLHARTRTQMYTPPIDVNAITQMVNAVKIPVVGNGDILTVEDARNMLDETGCSLVMVGRGVMGNLWLFNEIYADFNGLEMPEKPSLYTRLEFMRKHAYELCETKGEDLAMREFRTNAAYYLKGVKNASKFRAFSTSLTYYTDVERLVELVLDANRME